MISSRKRYRFRPPQRRGEPRTEYAGRLKQWRYEEACVKYVLDYVQLPGLRKELWKKHKSNDPEDFGRLTLADFRQQTNFPVWLGSRHMTWRRQPSMKTVLRDFANTPMLHAACDVCSSNPQQSVDRPFGVVFPVPKVKFMALHTLVSDHWSGAARMVMPTKIPGLTFFLERLDDLLDAVGPQESWQTCSHELNGRPQ
jgi:hypothetical protein